MKQKIIELSKRPSTRYLIIGGGVYLFEVVVILLAEDLGASPAWAVAISFSLGTLVSFFLQKLVTFGDRRMHHKVILSQAMATALLIVWNLVFTVLLAKLLEDVLPAVVARTIALVITTIWNFYLYKTRIFKA